MSEDNEVANRVRASFDRQALMALIGAELVRVEAGAVDIAIEFRAELTQQNGVLHAGIVTSILDSACGYAALTEMAPGREVLSVEFKVNLLRPARGARFVAEGRVVKAGRTLTVVSGNAYAENGDSRQLIATMLATMIQAPAS